MKWWVKLLGSGIGFVFGGPLGALLGMVVCHNVDRYRHPVNGSRPASKRSSFREDPFFTVTFQVMGHLAKADGRVSVNEVNAALAVMTYLNLNGDQKRLAIRRFNEGKQPEFELDAALACLRRDCSQRAGLLRRFLEIQLTIAYADGIPDARERRLLQYLCMRLGLPLLLFENLDSFARSHWYSQHADEAHRGRPAGRTDHLGAAYSTLGVRSEASDEEVRTAYRRLLNRYHPDKVAARGLSGPDLTAATTKTQQIRAAYEHIKLARRL